MKILEFIAGDLNDFIWGWFGIAILLGTGNIAGVAGAVAGGAVGAAIKMGFKRGIFSNEAGLGSSVMVHSASNVRESVHQELWGIFEVFFDTIIICTMTAIVVLSSGVIDLSTGGIVAAFADMGKNTLVVQAFTNNFGAFGPSCAECFGL